jgi:hypothetical protein
MRVFPSNTRARKCAQVFLVVLVGVLACVLPVALNASLDFQDDVGGYDGGCRNKISPAKLAARSQAIKLFG